MFKPKIPFQKGNPLKITSSGKGTIQNKVLSSKGQFDKTTDVNNVDLVQADSPAIQRKSSPNWSYQLKSITQHSNHLSPLQRVAVSPNKTGLPDNLKSGIESLSGMSMDHVKVHYNSAKPAQLAAHAYAQGADIHVGPGQEKHVPHEAWHVVQQAQGRVKPTTQFKQEVPLNDEVGLENEADLMGAKSLQQHSIIESPVQAKNCVANAPVQRSPFARAGVQIAKKGFGNFGELGAAALSSALAGGSLVSQPPPKMAPPAFGGMGGFGAGKPPLMTLPPALTKVPGSSAGPGSTPYPNIAALLAKGDASSGSGGFGGGKTSYPFLSPGLLGAHKPRDERDEDRDEKLAKFLDPSQILASASELFSSAKATVQGGVNSAKEFGKQYVDESKLEINQQHGESKYSADMIAKHSKVAGEDEALIFTLSQYLAGEISLDGIEKSFSAAINLGAGFTFGWKQGWETDPINLPGIGKIIVKLEDRELGWGMEVGAEANYDKKSGSSAGIYNKIKHSFAGTVNVRFADSGKELFNASAKGEAVLKNDAPDSGASSLEFDNVRVNMGELQSTPAALAIKDLIVRWDIYQQQNPFGPHPWD